MTLNKSSVDELVEAKISPILRVDGGTLEVISVDPDAHAVTLRFGGAYRGSPCRSIVLAEVVLPMLKEVFEELEKVEMAD